MINQSLSKSIDTEKITHLVILGSSIMPRDVGINESSVVQECLDPGLNSEINARKSVVSHYKSEILAIIVNDSFESGVVSNSESYINQITSESSYEFIREAANELYLEYYNNSQVLTGLLIMMGTLPYEKACPQGPTMALGLLQHENIYIRDRAIQLFERWNSKKGLDVLKSLNCDQKWLQDYVDKVIRYIERDGLD